MEDREHRSGGLWSAILVAGGAGLCCGGSVLLPLGGGMALLTGWLTEWGWLAIGGVVLCGLGVVLYRLRSKERHADRIEAGESV